MCHQDARQSPGAVTLPQAPTLTVPAESSQPRPVPSLRQQVFRHCWKKSVLQNQERRASFRHVGTSTGYCRSQQGSKDVTFCFIFLTSTALCEITKGEARFSSSSKDQVRQRQTENQEGKQVRTWPRHRLGLHGDKPSMVSR